MRYAFIGLGHLGVKLATSLLRANIELTVHDLDPTAAEPLLQAGAFWAASPAEAKPIGGLRLGLGALRRSFVRLFRRR